MNTYICYLALAFGTILAEAHQTGHWEFVEAPVTMTRAYEVTHGKVVEGRFTPSAKEYALAAGVDTTDLIRLVVPVAPSQSSSGGARYISSYRYLNGDWTYILSSDVMVYEVLRVKEKNGNAKGRELTAVLYNQNPPDAYEDLHSGWRLCFMAGGKMLRTFNMDTLSMNWNWRGRPEYQGGDMTWTDLQVVHGELVAAVTNVMTGSGGFPEQGYAFFFRPSKTGIEFVRLLKINDGRKKEWLK
jgi:hypothetical protein